MSTHDRRTPEQIKRQDRYRTEKGWHNDFREGDYQYIPCRLLDWPTIEDGDGVTPPPTMAECNEETVVVRHNWSEPRKLWGTPPWWIGDAWCVDVRMASGAKRQYHWRDLTIVEPETEEADAYVQVAPAWSGGSNITLNAKQALPPGTYRLVREEESDD